MRQREIALLADAEAAARDRGLSVHSGRLMGAFVVENGRRRPFCGIHLERPAGDLAQLERSFMTRFREMVGEMAGEGLELYWREWPQVRQPPGKVELVARFVVGRDLGAE